MVEYLSLEAAGKTISELADLINEKFGKSITPYQVETAKYRNGIKSYKKPGHYRLIFTDEIKKYIQENYQGKIAAELATEINQKFDTKFSAKQIRQHLDDNRLASGVDCRFKKGVEHFKYKEIGEERTDYRGRTYIKVADGRWKLKSHVVWEEKNGPMPEGTVLMYLDQDETNWRYDNLVLVSRKDQGNTLAIGLTEDPDINSAVINVAKMKTKLKEMEH